jgi:hypothetical protein
MSTNKILVVISAFVVVGALFYWYELRPAHIRSFCYKEAVQKATNLSKTKADLGDYAAKQNVEKGLYYKNDYNEYYTQCLSENGLEK